jgi:tetratricopeptide (TPR) repeat protein
LEQQIANNAADLDAYLKLAQMHVDEDRFGDAVLVLHKGLAASGNDLKFQERLEDVEILRKKHQLAVAEQRAGKDGEDEAQQLAKQLRDDLNRFEWEIFYARAERYPRDLEIKFQLGIRLKRLGKLREAMECFEATLRLPARLPGSALEMGECWQRMKEYSKALDCYRQAAERSTPEQIGLRKLALYRAGVLGAGLHNLEAAEKYFGELLELDADYKDAASRLDKIRGIRHKG